MNQVMEWVGQIAVFYLLMTVVEQLLPDSKYRKYVRLYLGMVMIRVVVAPVVSLANLEGSLEGAMKQVETELAQSELRLEAVAGNEVRYQMILDGYEILIREQASEITNREGYLLYDADVNFEENPEADDFGRILSIALVVGPKRTGIIVDPITVGENNSDSEIDPVLLKIQKELAAVYQLDPEQIRIEREGGRG